MAPKSKVAKTNFCRKVLLYVPALAAAAYLCRKCYIVLIHDTARRQEDKKWWIYSLFSSQDSATSTDVSILEREFYVQLFYVVVEDFAFLLSVISNSCVDLFSAIYGNLTVSVLCICTLVVLIPSLYFLTRIFDGNGQRNRYGQVCNEVTKTKERSLGRSNRDSGLIVCDQYRWYWRWMTGLLFLAVLLSIPWEFVRLYQSAVAEKVTHMTVGIPAECVPEQMTLMQSFKSWLRWQFSWSADPCLVYHKALLIDPVWQVSPLMVISLAFSHCIVYPVEVLLGGLGRALRTFFSEIPTQWQPFMLLIIVVFSLLTLVMMFGYRIHLPLIFKLEPRTPVSQRSAPRTSVRSRKESVQKSIEPVRVQDVSKRQNGTG